MDLNPDEQRLIETFRKLTPAAREELLGIATSMAGKAGARLTGEQCSVKPQFKKPETEQTPFFTE